MKALQKVKPKLTIEDLIKEGVEEGFVKSDSPLLSNTPRKVIKKKKVKRLKKK